MSDLRDVNIRQMDLSWGALPWQHNERYFFYPRLSLRSQSQVRSRMG